MDEDVNVTTFRVVQQSTEQAMPTKAEVSAAAAALGRIGGRKGGPARAAALSPAKRKARFTRKDLAALLRKLDYSLIAA